MKTRALNFAYDMVGTAGTIACAFGWCALRAITGETDAQWVARKTAHLTDPHWTDGTTPPNNT